MSDVMKRNKKTSRHKELLEKSTVCFGGARTVSIVRRTLLYSDHYL